MLYAFMRLWILNTTSTVMYLRIIKYISTYIDLDTILVHTETVDIVHK